MIWLALFALAVLAACGVHIWRLAPAEVEYLETRRRAEATLATLNADPEEN